MDDPDNTGTEIGSGLYFLQWVTFTKFIDGGTQLTAFEANKIYKVGTGATGIEIKANMLRETAEMEDYDLGINLTVTPWTEVEVTPGI